MQQFTPSIHHQHRTSVSEKEVFKNSTNSPVFSMENQRNLLSVQCSNNILDASQSLFPSASMQLPLQSAPSSKPIPPMLRSTPSPILRSTPSLIRSILSPIRSTTSPIRSTPSPIQPSSALLPPKTSVSETNESSILAKTLNMPSSCFTGMNRLTKKRKVDPMEQPFFK
ncbi:uncharacterized protein LOC115238861 [Formica exsecta]|uniref:uncharacterized protein LOC115238861 n=1 Tax=Formica exsecta TaxID=72781 RepID=UPI001143F6B5|nr:uncharacterized protein LOC115238861 [Formica exsecta]